MAAVATGAAGGGDSGKGVRDVASLLWRNPELLKVVLAAGFLASSTIMSPVTPMVLVQLRSRIWQEDMATFTAMMNSANGIVAMLLSGLFGRLGDRLGRRLAMALVGLLGFVPSWALLLLGQTGAGLDAYTALTVLGGIACITVTGCPTCYALVTDVIPADDSELAFGCCFAAVVLVAILGNAGGLTVNAYFEGSEQAILLWNCFLQLLFFVCVILVRIPPHETTAVETPWPSPEKPGATVHCPEVQTTAVVASATAPLPASVAAVHTAHADAAHDAAAPDAGAVAAVIGASEGSTEAGASTVSGSSCSTGSSDSRGSHSSLVRCVAPLQLLYDHPALCNLCWVAALVSLPEVLLTDVSAQFVLNQFGLLDSSDGARKKEVTLVFAWPGYSMLLPAFVLTGIFAKQVGPLQALRSLIPVTAVFLTSPVLLMFSPSLWLAAIVGLSAPFAMVVFSPLQTLISQIAPRDRVGEAMGCVGAAKQLASLASNLLVSIAVPAMVGSGVEEPLWVFFPIASVSSFLALWFAYRVQVHDPAKASCLGDLEDGCCESPGTECRHSAFSASPRRRAKELSG